MLQAAVSDPGLLALYGIGACCMGAFVGVYNVLGFRLTAAPFGLSPGTAGLVFLVYAIGTVSSAIAGRMAERFSRRAVVPVGCLITAAGVLLTLPGSLPCIVAGLAVMTAGILRGARRRQQLGAGPRARRGRRRRPGRVALPVRLLPRLLGLR